LTSRVATASSSFDDPNLFVIGAMRAGSTMICDLLRQHRDIFFPEVKEPMFYAAEALRQGLALRPGDPDLQAGLAQIMSGGRYRTRETFAHLYALRDAERYAADGSHYIYHPLVAGVLRRRCPHARIVVSLRNPVDRVLSEYQMRQLRGAATGMSFREFCFGAGYEINASGDVVLGERARARKGLYADLLAPWFEAFPREQFHFVRFEDVQSNAVERVRQILRWLDIDDDVSLTAVNRQRSGAPRWPFAHRVLNSRWPGKSVAKRLVGQQRRSLVRDRLDATMRRETLSPEDEAILYRFYEPTQRRLSGMTGMDFSDWSCATPSPAPLHAPRDALTRGRGDTLPVLRAYAAAALRDDGNGLLGLVLRYAVSGSPP